jgi:hypothetical protein
MMLLERLKAVVQNYGNHIHRSGDNVANLRGWTITETHWGLGRKYADPRWASFPKQK